MVHTLNTVLSRYDTTLILEQYSLDRLKGTKTERLTLIDRTPRMSCWKKKKKIQEKYKKYE